MLAAPPYESAAASGGCEARPLSILHHLASNNSLSSLRRSGITSGPYTLLTLPAEWVAFILSYLSPDEKLTEVCHVSSALHRSVVSLSSSFRDDFISFASLPLPPLLALSPWFKGVSGVSMRATGPDPFQLDKCGAGEELISEQPSGAEVVSEPQSENEDAATADNSPVLSTRGSSSLASSPSRSNSAPAMSSPFSSIRSLSISLSLDCSSPSVHSPPRSMLSSLSRWSNLRHLHIVADDTDDWLTAANLNCGLLTAQNFKPFLSLTHLRSLTLDATVKAEQVLVLAAMESLQCLLLTEREQRAGVDEERWQREEELMMAALSAVSRLIRKGRGLTQLRMPRFHFSVSADELCESLSEQRIDANSSPMSSLCVQGSLSRRGIQALASLPELTALTLGWGCELDADERTLAALSQCRDLQHLDVRLADQEEDDHDEETFVLRMPALPHVLAVSTLTSLSLHLPVSGWSVQHSLALSTLAHLRRLTLAGEASGISARYPLSYDKLLPLITVNEEGKRPLPHLRSLTLDFLPLVDDAILAIAQLTELTSLSLLNCPYLTSFLFCVLTALPALVLLKIYRCDVNLTEKGWQDAEDVLHHFRHKLPPNYLAHTGQLACFQCLQVLECHLVHRLSCDVDAAGFFRLLSLLPPRHLHTFDFDSDYCSSALLVQLASFPHLRSLGSLSVDVSPLDTELILAAKSSMSRLIALYYDRQYTRIERGERSRWRSRRRSSTAHLSSPDAAGTPSADWWLRSNRESEVEDDEEQRVLQEEGDDELNVDDDDCARWGDREERWCTQPRGVQFRHQQAREAFFQQLAAIDEEERRKTAVGEAQQMDAASSIRIDRTIVAVAATETDDESEEDSATEQRGGRADKSPRDNEVEDEITERDLWEGRDEYEQQQEEIGVVEGDDDGDHDSEYGQWEWSQHSSSSSSSSPSSLSVSLVGRSSKLHSRRYKRDEKMAIRLKASLPHAIDKSVRRGSSSGGVRLAGVGGQRKWEYAAAIR